MLSVDIICLLNHKTAAILIFDNFFQNNFVIPIVAKVIGVVNLFATETSFRKN